MFAAPQEIATRVFARLPDVYMSAAADNEWVRGQPADHPTSPAWKEGRYLKFVITRAR